MKLESVLQYISEYLDIDGFPDFPGAHNGLQVEGPDDVDVIAVSVDASEAVISRAVEIGAKLLIVHHGLFWDGEQRVVGRRFRKLAALIEGRCALLSVHLPLDAHPEVGNCAVLARALGLEPSERFGSYEGSPLGWMCTTDEARDEFSRRVSETVGGDVRVIPGGPGRVYRVAVVTGGAASLIREASEQGIDTLVTGEGPHHTFNDAMEFGVNALFAGHYLTEVWGVKALAAHLEERFGLEWTFIDAPTGL